MSNLERERRFIVARVPDDLDSFTPSIIYKGYFLAMNGYAIRVRRISTPSADGDEYGSIAVKGPRAADGTRIEEERYFEDPSLAGQLLRLCPRKVLKRRYALPDTWVIDVFDWSNEGLVIAELEGGPEIYSTDLPRYVGREISGETAFNNEWLAYRPWSDWSPAEKGQWT